MNIFVLTAGRTGSKTFARACSHATNVTVGHESLANCAAMRLDYPLDHIEVDSRLVWFTGELSLQWPRALYVRLVRDLHACAESHLRRMDKGRSIARMWRNGVLQGGRRGDEFEACLSYVRSVGFNVHLFLSSGHSAVSSVERCKPYVTVRLEHLEEDFLHFWRWAKLEGDLEAALAECRQNKGLEGLSERVVTRA